MESMDISFAAEILHGRFQQETGLLSQAAAVFEAKAQGIWYQFDSNFVVVSWAQS